MNTPAVLVTGAGTRLGSIFARHFATLGYHIALHCNTSVTGATELADQLTRSGSQCEVFRQDFNEAFDTDAFIAKIQARFAGLSCLVNNASAYEAAPASGTERNLLETQFRVNFFTPFLLSASFAKHVKLGSVINILDNKIAYQQYVYSAYLLSKKSLAEFTKMAALEFAPDVRVNGIAPGVTLPGDSRREAYVKWRLDGIPLKKKGEGSHLTSAIDYLLHNDFVTGQVLYVDGGEANNLVGRNYESYVDSQR